MAPRTHSRQLIGIFLKVASTLAFTAMATLVKLLSDRYPIGELTFFRSFFALFPVLAWVAIRGSMPTLFRVHNVRGHIIRVVVGTAGTFTGFTALSLLPIADATAIGYAAPLMTVILAVVFLGEKVHIYRWSAVIVGLAGVLIILSDYIGDDPGGERSALGAMLAIAGAGFGAVAMTQARVLVRTNSAATMVAILSLFICAVSLLTLPFGWVMPDLLDFVLLLLMGVFGGLGQVLMTTSFRYGDASTIAPFDYTSMVWALIVSLAVFGTWPTATTLIGSGIVILAGLFVIYREHRLGIERKAARRAQPPSSPPGG